MRIARIGALLMCAMLSASSASAKAATILSDVPYGADKEQRMDVYLPENIAKPAPILVMVHGGAWHIGDKDMDRVVDAKSDHYLSKGYIFISTNYRMKNNISPIDQADDLVHAIAEIEKQSPQWGGDPSEVILIGHSAGAHLVGLISAAPPKLMHPWRGSILLDSAAMDLTTIMQQRHYRFYDDVFGKDPEFWKAASPYHQLASVVAPMLLVCSTRRDISCVQAEAFAEKAKGLGTRAQVLKQDMSHGEINYKLGKPGDYTNQIDRFIESVL